MNYEIAKVDEAFKGFFKVNKLTINHDLFSGGVHQGVVREVFMRGSAAGVLLVDWQRQSLVLVEQFRAGAAAAGAKNPWLVELVAGIIEVDEAPIEVAARESEEEAGCSPSKLFPMCEYWCSPGGSDERFYLFCGLVDANLATDIGGLDHEHEDIKVHVVKISEAYKWLQEGKVDNAMLLIGLQWLKLNEDKVAAWATNSV